MDSEVEVRLLQSERDYCVRAAVRRLGERDGGIVAARYGLDGNGGATLKEVGHRFNISRERVRQIEVRAKRLIRRSIERLTPELADDTLDYSGPLLARADEFLADVQWAGVDRIAAELHVCPHTAMMWIQLFQLPALAQPIDHTSASPFPVWVVWRSDVLQWLRDVADGEIEVPRHSKWRIMRAHHQLVNVERN